MIEITDVSKAYKVGKEDMYVLNHVNVRIKEGEFVAIMGPSGSGEIYLNEYYRLSRSSNIRNLFV